MPGLLSAAIYARYSSDRQRDASIEDQERGCRKRAGELGFEVGEVYADRALSGADFLRPGFQRLIEDARRGRFQVVLAESLDRVSRDQEHIAGFYKLMRHLRIRVVTVAEGEINELHIGLKGTMNAIYLIDLGEKTRRGMEGLIKDGKSAGGNAYGYEVVKRFAPDGTPERGDRIIDTAQSKVVQRIFEDYARGLSSRAIAAQLNEEGVPGPRSTAWGASTIHGNRERGTGILNNELYIGRLVWNRQSFVKDPETGKRQARPNPPSEWIIEDVPHLRIVDDALWDRVRERQASNVVKNTSAHSWDRRRPRYLFSGLMVCGGCGSGFSKVGKNRFGCSAARNKGAAICTSRATIRREDLEARVLNALTEHLMDPDLVRVFCEEYTSERNRLRATAGAARAAQEAELQKVRREHANLVQSLKDGIPAALVIDDIKALDARRQQLEAELVAAPSDDPVRLYPNMAGTYRTRVRELVAGLADADPEQSLEAREAIRALVDRIVLTPSPEDPSVPVVDLEGALAGLLALATACNGVGANTNKAAPLGAALQSVLVAGAGFEPAAFRL